MACIFVTFRFKPGNVHIIVGGGHGCPGKENPYAYGLLWLTPEQTVSLRQSRFERIMSVREVKQVIPESALETSQLSELPLINVSIYIKGEPHRLLRGAKFRAPVVMSLVIVGISGKTQYVQK